MDWQNPRLEINWNNHFLSSKRTLPDFPAFFHTTTLCNISEVNFKIKTYLSTIENIGLSQSWRMKLTAGINLVCPVFHYMPNDIKELTWWLIDCPKAWMNTALLYLWAKIVIFHLVELCDDTETLLQTANFQDKGPMGECTHPKISGFIKFTSAIHVLEVNWLIQALLLLAWILPLLQYFQGNLFALADYLRQAYCVLQRRKIERKIYHNEIYLALADYLRQAYFVLQRRKKERHSVLQRKGKSFK